MMMMMMMMMMMTSERQPVTACSPPMSYACSYTLFGDG
jgi:hypothetical protein